MQVAEGQASEAFSYRKVTRANGDTEHHYSYWHKNPLKRLWWTWKWGRDGRLLNKALQEHARFKPN